jgi:hypothetical protein
MENWSQQYGDTVNFLCVCVDPNQDTALYFEREYLRHALNGWIPSRSYMPVGYGQLGCSGFVISDSNGNFVSRKTRAYLEYGEAAFRYVESILADLIPATTPGAPPSKISIHRGETAVTNDKKETTTSTDASKKVKPPESVGIASMDDEHKECTDSFNRLLERPSVETLIELIDILKAHFQHEEELMEKFMGNGSFSSLHSHKLDHKRILKIAENELDRVSAPADK